MRRSIIDEKFQSLERECVHADCEVEPWMTVTSIAWIHLMEKGVIAYSASTENDVL